MLLKSFFAAVAAYSAVPVPRTEWDDRVLKYALCFFPAVGVFCGAALWGWYALSRTLAVSGVLFAAAAACLPLLFTGGIHMDGYMDTVDALSSHQLRERKLEILKDPHCGAFAVVWCGVYLLLQTGLIYELYAAETVLCVCPGYVLSRALSAINAVTLPSARGSGMLHDCTARTAKRTAVAAAALTAVLAAAAMIALAPVPGLCAAALALLSVPCYRVLARREFGGATGDLAGFFLQVCELAILLGAWVGGLLP